MQHWLDWIERNRVLAISALNATVIVTFAILILAAAADSETASAQASAEASVALEGPRKAQTVRRAARSQKTESAASDRPTRTRRPPPRAERREPPRPRRTATQRLGELRSGTSRKTSRPRGSSFRSDGDTPMRVSRHVDENAIIPPRGIPSASQYGPWNARQKGDDALAPLPPTHPLHRPD